MTVWRVEREDDEDLGFVLDCVFAGAIDRAEFREWVWHVVGTAEHPLPSFFFDLDAVESFPAGLFRAIGFSPAVAPTEAERAALSAIAWARGRASAERVEAGEIAPRAEAEAALAAAPHVAARFRAAFPFIAL